MAAAIEMVVIDGIRYRPEDVADATVVAEGSAAEAKVVESPKRREPTRRTRASAKVVDSTDQDEDNAQRNRAVDPF